MKYLTALSLLLSVSYTQAATYWVSPTGAAANMAACQSPTPLSGAAACPITWSASTVNNPPTSIFTYAQPGDIVYFRGGTYVLPQNNYGDSYNPLLFPANSGTCVSGDEPCSNTSNFITFEAYPGETPILQGTPGGSGDKDGNNGNIMATTIGVYDQAYIIERGFTTTCVNPQTPSIPSCFPRVKVGWESCQGSTPSGKPNCYGTHDVIIDGFNIISSYTITGSDNAEAFRLETNQYVTLKNSRIGGMLNSADNHNTGCLKAYDTWNFTALNNEFYNSTSGFYYKSNVNTVLTAYNWVHDCYLGIYTDAWTSGWNTNDHTYHDNVFANNSSVGMQIYTESGGVANNPLIYNNTVYSASDGYGIFIGAASSGGASTNQRIYNNIIQTADGHYKLTFNCGTISQSDYNNFGSLSSAYVVANGYLACATNYYTTLPSWKSSGALSGGGNPDAHSIAVDPSFQNASGTLDQLSDFNLKPGSPSKRTGKGGSDMGAQICAVGPNASCSSTTASAPPAAPRGFTLR